MAAVAAWTESISLHERVVTRSLDAPLLGLAVVDDHTPKLLYECLSLVIKRL
jgi:hypothetical protein